MGDQGSFMTLPIELRLDIYKHIFATNHFPCCDSPFPCQPRSLAILRTCRRVYIEAQSVVCHFVTLRLSSSTDPKEHPTIIKALRGFNPSTLSRIQRISIEWTCNSRFFGMSRAPLASQHSSMMSRFWTGYHDTVMAVIAFLAENAHTLKHLTVLIPSRLQAEPKPYPFITISRFPVSVMGGGLSESAFVRIPGLKELVIGNTADFERVERIGRMMGVETIGFTKDRGMCLPELPRWREKVVGKG